MVTLGLMGDYPGVGKDTVAEYLVTNHGFKRMGFADRLYVEVSEAFGVTVAEVSRRDLKETPQARFALAFCADREFSSVFSEVYPDVTPDTPLSPRMLLRAWGTEYRRAQDEDYWVRQVFAEMDTTPGDYVVTDPRLGNELSGVVNRQGKLVRIDRPSVKPEVLSDHPSEVLARAWPEDYRLFNGTTLADLYAQIEGILVPLRRLAA